MKKSEKKSNISRRNFLDKGISKITAFTTGLLAALFFKRSQPGFTAPVTAQPILQTQQKNPYEYNIEDLKKVDPELITYEEIDQITIDLTELHGLALDSNDTLFVTGDKVILSFDNTGNQIKKIVLEDSANGITVDTNNQFYLCTKDHIAILNKDGSQVEKMYSLGEQAYLTSIAVSDKYIYAADAGNRVVWQFNKSGALLKRFGEKNPEKGIPGFIIPSPYMDIAVDQESNIWVANTGRHSLEKYNTEGDLITQWGKTSMRIEGFCGCCNPTHFALLQNGSFITSEKGLVRIKIYENQGTFKTVVAEPAQFDEGTVGLDLAVDSKDQIYVLDPKRKTVRMFSPKGSS